MSRPRWTLLLALSLAGRPVLAHQIQVFAFADGDRIEGSAYFVGGGAAPGVVVRVLDAQGRSLAEPVPDSEGGFSYRAEAPVDHLVVAETGDGHRAEWRVSAAELAPGFPGVLAEGMEPASPGAELAPKDAPVDPELVALIEQAVARQVRPLRQELLAAQGQARLRDILGGIGYILGLAGLLAWWRSRRSRGPA